MMFVPPPVNPWLILAVVGALGVTHSWAYLDGRSGGKKDVYAEWREATDAATNKKLDVKVKQDVIQNAPVDVAVTSRRLRAGTF